MDVEGQFLQDVKKLLVGPSKHSFCRWSAMMAAPRCRRSGHTRSYFEALLWVSGLTCWPNSSVQG